MRFVGLLPKRRSQGWQDPEPYVASILASTFSVKKKTIRLLRRARKESRGPSTEDSRWLYGA